MNFHELDNNIRDYKNYKLVAEYIVQNYIDIFDFFEGMEFLNEAESQGFFSKIGQKFDSVGQNIKNWWKGLRGQPYNVETVIKALQTASDFLNNNAEMKNLYKDEIESLARTIESMNKKSAPEPDTTSEMTEYLKRLTYGNPIDTLEKSGKLENAKLYAIELAQQKPEDVEKLKKQLMDDLKNKLAILEKDPDIKIEDYVRSNLNHESWALWDIGKQLYMSKNPSKSGTGYSVANPFSNPNIQKDMVDRMIGYAVEPTGKSSLELIKIGREALDKASKI